MNSIARIWVSGLSLSTGWLGGAMVLGNLPVFIFVLACFVVVSIVSICPVCDSCIVAICPPTPAARFAFLFVFNLFCFYCSLLFCLVNQRRTKGEGWSTAI